VVDAGAANGVRRAPRRAVKTFEGASRRRRRLDRQVEAAPLRSGFESAGAVPLRQHGGDLRRLLLRLLGSLPGVGDPANVVCLGDCCFPRGGAVSSPRTLRPLGLLSGDTDSRSDPDCWFATATRAPHSAVPRVGVQTTSGCPRPAHSTLAMLQERRTAELGFGQEGRLLAIALRPGHPSRWSSHAQAMLDDAVNALPESSLFQLARGAETGAHGRA